jgi:hypothetical protein
VVVLLVIGLLVLVRLDPDRWRSATADLPFAQEPRTSTWKVQRPELARIPHNSGSQHSAS